MIANPKADAALAALDELRELVAGRPDLFKLFSDYCHSGAPVFAAEVDGSVLAEIGQSSTQNRPLPVIPKSVD